MSVKVYNLTGIAYTYQIYSKLDNENPNYHIRLRVYNKRRVEKIQNFLI